MRIITKKINAYKYDELSQGAKNKVLDRFRDTNDYPFLYDDLKEFVEEKLRVNKIHIRDGFTLLYSLSYDQGDGLCFIGKFKWHNYSIFIKHIGRYYHLNGVDISIITQHGNNSTDKVYEDFKLIYKDICKLAEKHGYDTIDVENSEETIKQTIEANNYEFDDEGNVI